MRYLLLLITVCLAPVGLSGQDPATPALERDVTLAVNNQPLTAILESISQQTGLVFSYNPRSFGINDLYTLAARHKTVRQALNLIFNGTVTCKARGKYIILRKDTPGNANTSRKHVIDGYITDARSGQKLTGVSIYDKEILASATTDRYGYFKLEIPLHQVKPRLHICKQGYLDTLLVPSWERTNTIDIGLSGITIAKLRAGIDSTRHDGLEKTRRLVHWFVPEKTRINTRNIKDTIFKHVQFSLAPAVSTNRLLAGSSINDVSVNITVGYIQGSRAVEAGGLLNIVRDDVTGVQLAGLGNIVGNTVTGFQVGGACNVASTMRGLQVGGLLNIVHGGKARPAGASNQVDGSCQGVQLAGLYNQARDLQGVQVACVMNHSRDVSGVQVSGIINKATCVRGLQVSLLNFADSCAGIPLGFLSFVKKGYHKIEFSADELFYTNIAFRTGVKPFHTILMASLQPDDLETPLWSFGYGIGTTLGTSDKLAYDIDISGQQIIVGDLGNAENTLYKLYVGIDWNVFAKTSIAAGLTYNVYARDTRSTSYQEAYASIAPYSLSSTTLGDGTNLTTWVGGKVSIRFL